MIEAAGRGPLRSSPVHYRRRKIKNFTTFLLHKSLYTDCEWHYIRAAAGIILIIIIMATALEPAVKEKKIKNRLRNRFLLSAHQQASSLDVPSSIGSSTSLGLSPLFPIYLYFVTNLISILIAFRQQKLRQENVLTEQQRLHRPPSTAVIVEWKECFSGEQGAKRSIHRLKTGHHHHHLRLDVFFYSKLILSAINWFKKPALPQLLKLLQSI